MALPADPGVTKSPQTLGEHAQGIDGERPTPKRPTPGNVPVNADSAAIKAALAVILEPGQVTELRALNVADGNRTVTYTGYFNDHDKLAAEAARLGRSAEGVYIIPNPVKPELLARAQNRVKVAKQGDSTGDGDIDRRHWLLLDADPDRPRGISSTDDQHQLALDLMADLVATLSGAGWPDPILADSGNGAHALYALDLDNSKENTQLLQMVLLALAQRFDTDGVHLDQVVYNPSRIWKLYGTVARKGDNTADRPHRLARILTTPDPDMIPVSSKQLQALAKTVPEAPKPTTVKGKAGAAAFDIDTWIATHIAGQVESPTAWNGGRKWILTECPWGGSDHHKKATIVQHSSGAISASCRCASCNGHNWAELREMYDPAADRVSKLDKKPPRRRAPEVDPDADEAGDDYMPAADRDAHLLLHKDAGADDNGNALAMFFVYGRDFLYTPAYGWLSWTGSHWAMVPEQIVQQKAIRLLTRRQAAAALGGKQYEEIVAAAKPSAAHVGGLLILFKSYVIESNTGAFDADPDLLNCKNGVLNLQTGKLVAHDPRTQRFTYCVPVDYDPAADTSAWSGFTLQALGGKADVAEYFQTCVGYSFTGHTREEKMFYPYGPPRAGKGTFTETILALMPHPLGHETDFNTFTQKREADNQNFDLAELKPARIVFASESNKYQSLNPAKIKAITGGNYVRCAFKHKDMFSYRPQFKVWLISNHPLRADADDDAMWGRAQVFEFPNSHLGAEDTGLKARMKSPANLKAVLAWAVAGAQRWYKVGLVEPEAVKAATKKHRDQQDFVGQWILDSCRLDPDTWTSADVLYQSYRDWCESEAVERPQAKNDLMNTLASRFGCTAKTSRVQGQQKRGYTGIALDPNGSHTDPDDGADKQSSRDALRNISDHRDAGASHDEPAEIAELFNSFDSSDAGYAQNRDNRAYGKYSGETLKSASPASLRNTSPDGRFLEFRHASDCDIEPGVLEFIHPDQTLAFHLFKLKTGVIECGHCHARLDPLAG